MLYEVSTGDYTKAVHPELRKAGWNGYWIDAASSLRMEDDAVIILDPVNRNVIDAARITSYNVCYTKLLREEITLAEAGDLDLPFLGGAVEDLHGAAADHVHAGAGVTGFEDYFVGPVGAQVHQRLEVDVV